MKQDRFSFLFEMLETPSPTGCEQPLQRKICRHFENVAHEIEPDVHGNLILTLNPHAKRTVMLAGHCDQIGFLVKYISPEGFIYLDALGGTDSGVVLGEQLVIQGHAGPVVGIVGRKPLHLQQGAEMQQIPAKHKIWVDIGARDEKEAREVVREGNYVTFPLQITRLRNDLIAAPALDNKAGLFVCLEVLRECARRGCEMGLHVASTVQEEIGSRGASTATSKLKPDIGIAVDTVPATDDPGYDLAPQQFAPCKLGQGPTISTGPNTNPAVGKLLVEAAKKLSTHYQVDPSGSTIPNDSRIMQVADSGLAAASVGIPLRNMHTQVEVAALSDLEQAVEILAEFICSLKTDTELRPFYFEQDRAS